MFCSVYFGTTPLTFIFIKILITETTTDKTMGRCLQKTIPRQEKDPRRNKEGLIMREDHFNVNNTLYLFQKYHTIIK